MKKIKVYIAAPYSSKALNVKGRAYGIIKDRKYIEFLEVIDRTVRDTGFETVLPHRDNNQWGKIYLEPKEMVRKCYKQIESSDIFICYPERSRGVHIELGIASALGKRIIILLRNREKPSSVALGLHAITPTIILRFENENDLKEKLIRTLMQIRQWWDDARRSSESITSKPQ